MKDRIKQELWRRFGNADFPAEWDGKVLGGGKLSQRFWEYFKAVDLLDVDEQSVILDIGGGSPETGRAFLASLLSQYVKQVILIDPEAVSIGDLPENVVKVPRYATPHVLKGFLGENSHVTHIASVSVLEHIPPAEREKMVETINSCFLGQTIVFSFEFHPRIAYFQWQLTNHTLSNLVSHFTNFYVTAFESSPVWCEIAFGRIPRWYPVVLKLTRNQ